MGSVAYIGLERRIARAETELSTLAVLPIVGTIAGVVKMLIGVIQTVGGILAMVASPLCGRKNFKDVLSRGFSHLVNGPANIVTAAIEAIPLIGSVAGVLRVRRTMPAKVSVAGYDEENMIVVGYKILRENPRTRHGKPVGGNVSTIIRQAKTPWISV